MKRFFEYFAYVLMFPLALIIVIMFVWGKSPRESEDGCL